VPIDTTLYTLAYLERRQRWKEAYVQMADVFATAFGLGSAIDVGCAGGLLVEALRRRGYKAWGLDGAPACESLWPAEHRHYYRLADLSRCDEVETPATDLVCSMEVAEHLPESSAIAYVRLLTRHHPRRILFTAAPTGQPGTGHVNCRPFSYWIALFATAGYELDLPGACYVRHRFRSARDPAKRRIVPRQYANNFLTFVPEGTQVSSPTAYTNDDPSPVSRELDDQRAVLDLLSIKSAHVTEFIALLRRSLGEPTEHPEPEVARLRAFIN
jgi:2-polyprenyl-3-methyl-5-hydroxy-6-metoxy-1,4-benzoquinol methylase